MEKSYLIEKAKISDLLNELDNFKTKMDSFNNKYGDLYDYDIEIYTDDKKPNKKSLYKAEINITRNE
jgi:hypothetical protein